MSTPFESTRVTLVTLVKSFHDSEYPSLEVNYPDDWITDVEHTSDPFVTVELTMRPQNKGLPHGQCVEVSGQLILNHFSRINQGMKLHSDYTDKLITYLGYKTLSGVTFRDVIPYDNTGIPGFKGIMNAVNFEIEYFNI